jgi:hypothetical protein
MVTLKDFGAARLDPFTINSQGGQSISEDSSYEYMPNLRKLFSLVIFKVSTIQKYYLYHGCDKLIFKQN